MPSRYARRAGLVFGGFLAGLLLVLILVYAYFRTVTDARLAERILHDIDLPAEVLRIEAIEGDTVARVAVRDVEIRDESGARIAAAPLVRLVVDLTSLAGDGPIELREVLLSEPSIDFVQYPDGETNFSGVLRVTAGGDDVDQEASAGRGVVIRDLRIANGNVRWASPYEPDSAALAGGEGSSIRLQRIGGTLMRVRTVQDLDVWAPSVRAGGAEGWRVQVAAASAQLTDPGLRIVSLAGVAEQAGESAARFTLDNLRTENSSLSGAGLVSFGGESPQFDVTLRAAPLAFSDLRWFAPTLPSAGQVEGSFDLASRESGQTAVTATDLVVTAFDSRVTGRFSALVGGERPASFWDTRLELDPLRIETIEQLGLVDDLPYTGEIRGTLSSDAVEAGSAAELTVDLAASFTPEGGGVPTSTVFMRGPVTVGAPDAAVQFGGVELAFQPLHLEALRPLAPPEQAERLRGVLRGSATLRGTPTALRVENGDLAYEVGDASRTRLTDLTLDLRTEPEMRFRLEAQAEPLALGTLSELFPAFPFRTASFAGPILIEGTAREFRIDTELSGAAGLIAVNGTIAPGEVLRFDLSGRVASFNTQTVLSRPTLPEGPVTGTFAVAGTTESFAFNVDLLQESPQSGEAPGRLALGGNFRRVAGQPIVDVAGNVVNFNLGALMGRPTLFPSRMTGTLRVAGGGREPIGFDVDLRGAAGVFDVEGTYTMGTIPSYRVVGRVGGLNLRQLPGGENLPMTDLNADVDIRGQGTTLETLAGEFRVDATRSTLAGRPVEALLADVTVRDGVARFDTLAVALTDTRLSAEGTWGLTRPSAEPLNFRLVSTNLGTLAPFLPTTNGVPPQMTGSFTLSGSVAGSVRVPVVDVVFAGDNLRYEGWRARRLEFGLAATLSRKIEEIRGELTLTGRDLDLAGRAALASLSVGLEGGGSQVDVRVAAERDTRTGLAFTGLLEMQGPTPVGVLLDSLVIRTADQLAWQLTTPSRVRWAGTEGVLVSNLNLARADGQPGRISIDGAVPPSGIADLRIDVQNFDLALVRQLVPNSPVVGGIVDVNAVLEGPVTDPELTLDGSVTQLQYRDVALDSIALTGRYSGRIFDANATVRVAGTELATATAAVPMRLAFENGRPTFALLRENPLRAQVVADSLPLALLASSVPTIRDPTGVFSAEFSATGTIDQPRLLGWAELHNAAATFTDLGVRYDAMRGRASFDGEVVRIDSLVIRSGGTARASGTVRLVTLESPELQIEARLDDFRAMENDEVADLTVSGIVALSGRMPRPILTGQVTVNQSVIYFPNFGQEVPLALTELEIGEVTPDTVLANAVGPGFVQNVQVVDLDVTLGDQVWMEAPTARVQIRGGLVVYRSGLDMRLYGNLEAVRGTYALTIGPIVREFDVTGGSVRFLGTPDVNPELDITAEHEIRTGGTAGAGSTLSIVVRVTGTAEFPRVALTSDTQPPLPESELLNYLVFGQPSFRLSQQQGFAQQLVVQEVLGGLLVQELGQLGLPCQYLRLRGRPTEIALGSPLAGLGATSLECGVQILPDVFLTLETGVTSAVNPSNPFNALLGVSLDWEIKDYLAARVAREPVRSGAGAFFQSSDVPYQWSADLNGRWEFGRPDTAARIEPPIQERRLPGQVAPALPVPGPSAPPAPRPAPTPQPASTPAAATGSTPARSQDTESPQ